MVSRHNKERRHKQRYLLWHPNKASKAKPDRIKYKRRTQPEAITIPRIVLLWLYSFLVISHTDFHETENNGEALTPVWRGLEYTRPERTWNAIVKDNCNAAGTEPRNNRSSITPAHRLLRKGITDIHVTTARKEATWNVKDSTTTHERIDVNSAASPFSKALA